MLLFLLLYGNNLPFIQKMKINRTIQSVNIAIQISSWRKNRDFNATPDSLLSLPCLLGIDEKRFFYIGESTLDKLP